jgi:ABC-type nickel/cobalt efflux system permease component RcnA
VVGSTRGVASVVAAAAGTSLTVTGAVVLLLDDDSVTVTVISVNEQGKKLERYQ